MQTTLVIAPGDTIRVVKHLPLRFSDAFHEIYRFRFAYFALVILVVANLAAVPGYAIYRDAREAGLLTMMKITAINTQNWQTQLVKHRKKLQTNDPIEDPYFGRVYLCNSGVDRARNKTADAFYSQYLRFVVRNEWHQKQLNAWSDLQPKYANASDLPTSSIRVGACESSTQLTKFGDSTDQKILTVGDPEQVLNANVNGIFTTVILWIIALSCVVLVLSLFLKWFTRSLFGLYTRDQLPIHSWHYKKNKRNCLWLYPDELTWELLEGIDQGNQFDVHEFINPGRVPNFNAANPDTPTLVINLDVCLVNPVVAKQILSELERQAYEQDRQLIITSNIDPMAHIVDFEPRHCERWSRLLKDFDLAQGRVKVVGGFSAEVDELKLPDHLSEIVKAELGWNSALFHHLPDYKSRLPSLLEKQVQRLLAKPQLTLCANLFHESTAVEKRLLYQLAKGNLVNPSQWETVLTLEARGLLLRDPRLRLVSFGLEKAILNTVTKTEAHLFSTTEEESTWSKIKLPFIVMFGLAAMFLFVTQRELFDLTQGMAMGAVVALPAIMRLLTMFNGSDNATKGSSST